MKRFSSQRLVIAMLVVVGIMTLPVRASAGERPHQSRGTAQFVSPTDFVGSGKATHLGHYTEVGSAQFSPTANPTVLRIDGWSIYTAANGDQLYATITGFLNAQTGGIVALVTYEGGTGRFDDASGWAILLGKQRPDGTIVVAVEGTIDY